MYNKYSVKTTEKEARVKVHSLNASYKDLSQICRNIRGMNAEKAVTLMGEVMKKETPIHYYTFNTRLGHRKKIKGKGRYPVKEAKIVKKALKDVIASAEFKGLQKAKLIVSTATANKQNIFPRYKKFWVGSVVLGYGKQAVFSNYVTAILEIVVKEV
jgi:large subunit ribosomal protein L22